MALLRRSVALGALLAAGVRGEWKPVDSVMDLDAVEAALHQFEHAKMTPAEEKATLGTVRAVEKTVLQLRSDQKLTKEQKGHMVKEAIDNLQAIQSQWQLALVEGSLKQVLASPHLTAEQLASAKKVVADVDSVVEACEKGTLKGAAKAQSVSLAIKELSSFERSFTNASVVAQKKLLESELAEKQAELKLDEGELKLAKMQKKLALEKGQMKRLMAQKAGDQSMKKEQQEDAAQQSMVAKLLGFAKAMAASKKHIKVEHEAKAEVAKIAEHKGAAKTAALDAILKDLHGRANNVTTLLAKMDAAEATRESEWKAKNPVQKNAKVSREAKIEQAMERKVSRSFSQMRAVKVAELKEVNEAIHSIEKGDVAGLSKVMVKMQSEYKAMEAKSKNFLY